MRNVTQSAIKAFTADKNFTSGNTSVIANGAITGLYLHGYLIAEKNKVTGMTKITSAGLQSNTTKERLNGLPGVSIAQKAGVWYLNGKEWDGEWTRI